jgi:uncharacterized membrane protein
MTRTVQPVARWAVVVTFLLSLLGLAISIYMTYQHFHGSTYQGCSTSGFENCTKVTTSPQSRIFAIPVAVLGVVNYAAMSVLNSPWAWRAKSYWIHAVRFVLAMISMCLVLWLITAELLIIKSICLYCTSVHIITFALLIVLTIVSPAQLGWARSTTQESPTL